MRRFLRRLDPDILFHFRAPRRPGRLLRALRRSRTPNEFQTNTPGTRVQHVTTAPASCVVPLFLVLEGT